MLYTNDPAFQIVNFWISLKKVNITSLVKIKDTCDEKVKITEEAVIFGLDAVMKTSNSRA